MQGTPSPTRRSPITGRSFRTVELHAVRAGRIVRTEVYFGWNLPHPARPGGFVENDRAGRAGA